MLGEEELAVWAEALHVHLDEDARGVGEGGDGGKEGGGGGAEEEGGEEEYLQGVYLH